MLTKELVYSLRFEGYLVFKQVGQKTAYFLSAQTAVLSSSFSVFIVLEIYNFDSTAAKATLSWTLFEISHTWIPVKLHQKRS